MIEKNASFIQRLGALLIDMFLISMIVSFVTVFVVNNDNYTKLAEEASNVVEDYMKEKITLKVYMNKSMDISYDLSRQTAIVSFVSITLYILYFIIFQFKNNGQTLGKKLMKIRVVSNDSNDLTINQMAVRALIIDFILANMITLTVTILGTKNIYFVTSMILEVVQYALLFAIAIMVLSRKDKRGLHDVITNTKVIKEI